jgi:hypothetical protein
VQLKRYLIQGIIENQKNQNQKNEDQTWMIKKLED